MICCDAEDRIFVVEIPELPGCTAHGATKREALQNAQKAAQLWAATARKDGMKVPQPPGRMIPA